MNMNYETDHRSPGSAIICAPCAPCARTSCNCAGVTTTSFDSNWNRTGVNSNRRKPCSAGFPACGFWRLSSRQFPELRIHQRALSVACRVCRQRIARSHRQPANPPGPVNPGQPRSTLVNPEKFFMESPDLQNSTHLFIRVQLPVRLAPCNPCLFSLASALHFRFQFFSFCLHSALICYGLLHPCCGKCYTFNT
jgi:hypothetical protein